MKRSKFAVVAAATLAILALGLMSACSSSGYGSPRVSYRMGVGYHSGFGRNYYYPGYGPDIPPGIDIDQPVAMPHDSMGGDFGGMPDMGMPDMGGMDMDVGGFDF
jgi:hypothetical protein